MYAWWVSGGRREEKMFDESVLSARGWATEVKYASDAVSRTNGPDDAAGFGFDCDFGDLRGVAALRLVGVFFDEEGVDGLEWEADEV